MSTAAEYPTVDSSLCKERGPSPNDSSSTPVYLSENRSEEENGSNEKNNSGDRYAVCGDSYGNQLLRSGSQDSEYSDSTSPVAGNYAAQMVKQRHTVPFHDRSNSYETSATQFDASLYPVERFAWGSRKSERVSFPGGRESMQVVEEDPYGGRESMQENERVSMQLPEQNGRGSAARVSERMNALSDFIGQLPSALGEENHEELPPWAGPNTPRVSRTESTCCTPFPAENRRHTENFQSTKSSSNANWKVPEVDPNKKIAIPKKNTTPMIPYIAWAPMDPLTGCVRHEMLPPDVTFLTEEDIVYVNKFREEARMADENKEKPRSTVMLRNIPNKYTQPMLLRVLNDQGFKGKYDFFYLPINFQSRVNMGYAFINFPNTDIIPEFRKAFHKTKLTLIPSTKVCEVAYAKVQGLQANLDVYRNSPVNGIAIKQYRPLLFDMPSGEELPFPEPDAPLPPLQLRAQR